MKEKKLRIFWTTFTWSQMDRSFATMMIPVLSFLPVTIYKGWFTLVAMCCESAAVRVFLEMQTTADSQMYSAKKIYSLRFLQDHEVFAYICWANFVLSAWNKTSWILSCFKQDENRFSWILTHLILIMFVSLWASTFLQVAFQNNELRMAKICLPLVPGAEPSDKVTFT